MQFWKIIGFMLERNTDGKKLAVIIPCLNCIFVNKPFIPLVLPRMSWWNNFIQDKAIPNHPLNYVFLLTYRCLLFIFPPPEWLSTYRYSTYIGSINSSQFTKTLYNRIYYSIHKSSVNASCNLFTDQNDNIQFNFQNCKFFEAWAFVHYYPLCWHLSITTL